MKSNKITKSRIKYKIQKSLQIYNGVEGIDFVECKICKKRSLYIDTRHLRNIHNLTKMEYIKLFPNAILVSTKKKNIQRKNAIGNKSNLGKKFSEESRKKISKARFLNNGFKGKHHTKENIKRSKISRENTLIKKYGVTNPMLIQSVREKVSKKRAEAIINGLEIYSKSSKKGYFYSKKNDKLFFYRSSFEEKYMKILENNNNVRKYYTEPFSIPYIYNNISHRYIPDFLINDKYIVEIKPKFMFKYKKTREKIKAAVRYSKLNNMKFILILTENIQKWEEISPFN